MKRSTLTLFLLVGIVILVVFRNWVLLSPLSSGDWGFYYNSALRDFQLMPQTWDGFGNNGLGGFSIYQLPLFSYFYATSFLLFYIFHIDWIFIERIIWFWPFLLISFLSSFIFLRAYLDTGKAVLVGTLFFLFNTYIFMMVGGGQMGVAMGYAIVPIVLYSGIILVTVIFDNKNFILIFRNTLFLAILASIQLIFDIRMLFITLFAISLYAFFIFFISLRVKPREMLKIAAKGIIAGSIFSINVIYIHFVWILPILLNRHSSSSQLLAEVPTLAAVHFFSFTTFENAIGLLHPYWPENVFGKIGFMKPEFLILPILAYSSLFFIKKKSKNVNIMILFFSVLGITGAFLAKGTNDPFGNVYTFLFTYIPGFFMFRDSTKWYTLIVISYMVLIPFSLIEYGILLKNFISIKKIKNSSILKKSISLIPIFCFLFYMLVVLQPVFSGSVSGTFAPHKIPIEYTSLAQFLDNQPGFFRTLWYPSYQRYGFSSEGKRASDAKGLFKAYSNNTLEAAFSKKNTLEFLQNASVKYIIVPDDIEKEIYITNRKYDETIPIQAMRYLKTIKWLHEIPRFGKIHIFEVENYKDHFWTTEKNVTITSLSTSTTHYKIQIHHATKGSELIFSENFDSNWTLLSKGAVIHATAFQNRFNSFTLPFTGDYMIEIYYLPQKYVHIGLIISITSFMISIGVLLFMYRKSQRQ